MIRLLNPKRNIDRNGVGALEVDFRRSSNSDRDSVEILSNHGEADFRRKFDETYKRIKVM